MITTRTKLTPDPNVITTSLSNQETVLLHLNTQQYYTLNETGTQIWQGLADAQSLETIGQGLEAKYDLTLDQACQHVIELVTGLAREQLVQVVEKA